MTQVRAINMVHLRERERERERGDTYIQSRKEKWNFQEVNLMILKISWYQWDLGFLPVIIRCVWDIFVLKKNEKRKVGETYKRRFIFNESSIV